MAFNRFDAEAIYRIPLSRRCVPDKLFWLHNKNGRYSVKSGYHTARLRQRRIIENALCPICMQVPETIVHTLWECGAVQDVWAGCPQRALQKGLTAQASVLQLVEVLMQRLPEDALEAFLVQCWLFWHRRNRVVHGGLLQEPGVLIDRAKSLLAEYKDAQVLLSLPAPAGLCLGWQPPDSSTYKLNFDAAVFSNASASGVGVMIRNAGGQADWSRLGILFDDICCLAGRLRRVEFKAIRRAANGAAHSLARFARNIREEIVWLEEDPPPALEALYVDSCYLSYE
ncbi:uncharacterized protein LOC126719971 [Quercus robur]|uniref:uncharacterized protein LOC126719971 n=1 Tax=Quercus robur TaxID=38942 RepID=UPI002161FD56|nr:uncharacterized protein LOC126719971 [Quercus robur]